MNYLIDSNILIRSKNNEYPFDFFPGYWDFMNECFKSGSIFMHKKVYNEIKKGKDDLSRWVEDNKNNIAIVDEDSVEESLYLSLSEWAEDPSNDFTKNAIEAFCRTDKADIWLCAKAKDKDFIIVTDETFERAARKSIKIPNVCEAFGILYMDKFTFIRKMKAEFFLKDGYVCQS